MELLSRSTIKIVLLLLSGSSLGLVDQISASDSYQGPMRAPDGPYYSSEQLLYPDTIKAHDQQLRSTNKDQRRPLVSEKVIVEQIPYQQPPYYYYPSYPPTNNYYYPQNNFGNYPYMPYPFQQQYNPYGFR
jgi:hypothetical protein